MLIMKVKIYKKRTLYPLLLVWVMLKTSKLHNFFCAYLSYLQIENYPSYRLEAAKQQLAEVSTYLLATSLFKFQFVVKYRKLYGS